ncbi:N-acetylneuraminate synthase family protein [Thermodesulfobacteriota bacterium]
MGITFEINGITIGEENPAVTIAEAAVEHLGSLNVAKRMADVAKSIGADFIKYQLHLPEDEMIPNSIHFWGGSLDDVLAQYNLNISDHEALMTYCEDIGIQYLCTPFCSKAADILDELGAVAFKIGSGEMTNIPMIRSIAKKGKPMIVSTGMATLDEIDATVAVLVEEKTAFALMNCTSIYPAPYDKINLGFIPEMMNRYGVPVGHSDHTPDIWTSLGAVMKGAKIVEKHFTLKRDLKGPDFEVSLEPEAFGMMIDAIRKLEMATGAEKRIFDEEAVVRDWAHHSVVSLCPIKKGTVLTEEMVGVKRPGRGIPARHMHEFIGQVATRNIEMNELLAWEDISRQG